MDDLEKAPGQYTLYAEVLHRLEPDRQPYLGVSVAAFAAIFEEPVGSLLIESQRLRLMVFDPEREAITRWVPERTTASGKHHL